MTNQLFFIAVFTITLLTYPFVYADLLQGSIDQASGTNWQSSYMDLDQPRDFKKGERLKIKLQGAAEWVLVRLLPYDAKPDKPTGLIGEKMRVPPGGELEITLLTDHPKVKQISVHAGKEAWGKSLSSKNGNAQIVSIDVLPR